MPAKKSGRSYVNASVSFPPWLLAQARKRAKSLGLPFSTYVQKCLERDLMERGAIVFAERILTAAEDAPPVDDPPRRRSASGRGKI